MLLWLSPRSRSSPCSSGWRSSSVEPRRRGRRHRERRPRRRSASSASAALVLLTDVREKQKQITTISAIYFGLLLGLLLGWLFSLALVPILDSHVPGAAAQMVLLVRGCWLRVICCYVTISTLLQTKDEFRFIIPYVEFSKQVKGGRPLVLDTSVIIDGRIADMCDTRLIDTKLIVPRFVLQELQAIADSSDKLKRNRGRRGLDMLKRLQSNPKIELQMHDGNVPELRTGEQIRVDERLVVFAKALGARVVTNDFNLNKIAQLQGVDVINLNELANALKTVALPGEYDAGEDREAGRPDRPGRRLPGRRHDGGGRAGADADRPGGVDRGDERAADAGRADDLRPPGPAGERVAHAVPGPGRRRPPAGRRATRRWAGRRPTAKAGGSGPQEPLKGGDPEK